MTAPEEAALGGAAYVTLYEQSAVPTLTIDHLRRQILHVNQAALTMLGLEADQILGRPGTDFLTKPKQAQLERVRALRGDETAVLMDVPTTMGVRMAEVNLVPSGLEGIVFVQLLDVTDLLDATAHAEARVDELSRTSAALRTIASRLAHDLRGPLTSIAGFASLLLDEAAGLSDGERADMLDRIRANTTALAAMTGSILSEADTGATRPEDDSHDTDDLFRVLRSVTEAQLSECAGTIEMSSEITVLPVAVGVIRQAVLNLVSNSIKYRDPSRALRIELLVRQGADAPEIVVRDNGRGLSDDVADLFAAGTRGQAAGGTTGAGLGLAFAWAAVETFRGSITGAALDPGAEFVITLPSASPAEVNTQPDVAVEVANLTAPQFERVIDASPVPTLVIDIPLRQIVSVNRAVVALMGLDDRDIVGRQGSDFLDEQAIVETLRRQVLDEPSGESLHTNVRTEHGDVPARIWVAAVAGTALAVVQVVPDEPAAAG